MSNKLDTNLNVSPYFDDYDSTKNFHRILFKPTVAVQTRELIQLQTILQDQISRFGDYMFKDGAIVSGCAISYIEDLPVVYVTNRFDTDETRSPLDIDETYMLYANTGVRAAVVTAKVGFELTYPATNRFYVAYLSGGKDLSNTDIFEFQSGEKLYLYNSTQEKFGDLDANNLIDSISIITANGTANATATSYGITTSDGVIYQKGFFINVDRHTIPVRDHDQLVDQYVVGFDTNESIINSDQDSSLKSNAAGFYNFNAPGADRLKLTPSMISKPRSDTNTSNFFAIAEFDGKTATEHAEGEKNLNSLRDILAQRTHNQSGNFSSKPFKVEATLADSNTVNNFKYTLSSGIAYINGYEVPLDADGRGAIVERATTTREAEAQIVTANFGNYIIVDEAVGTFDFDKITEITLYDAPQNSISEYEGSSTAPSGTLVGYANILGYQYVSGAKGTPTARYKLFLTNIRMNTGKSFATDVKSFYANGTYGKAKADVVLENSLAILKDSNIGALVFPFGVSAIKRLRDSLGGNDTNFVFRDITSATMAANGTVTFTINSPANGGTEKLNSSVGVLSSTNGLNYNIKTSADAYSANLTGTIAITSGSNTITGTSTTFQTTFNVGDNIRINTGAGFQLRNITSISSNTTMTVDATLGTSNTTSKFQKFYPAGHVVNFSDFGGSITVLSNTQFVADTNMDSGTGTVDSGTQTVYAEYPVLRSDAVEAKKAINKNVFVKIDCSNNAGGTTGPWDLGFVDVQKVRAVYVSTTYSTSVTDRRDWFVLNNGQKDSFYDHAQLVMNNRYSSVAGLTSASKILVELDHFAANTSTGVGFFSVDSYPIDDANTANTLAIQTGEIPLFYSSIYGQVVDLRNAVDFRPRKFNTANSTNSIASATINPAVANSSFDVPATGQYVIDPDTNFQADLEYYLPRVDLITIDKDGNVVIRKGQPSEKPIKPMNENDTVVLAYANVTPYPTLTTTEAADMDRPDLLVTTTTDIVLRYTMQDIKNIDERIARLEYYTTLNLLESKAKDTTILDENGIDRFKNGIFAESFQSGGLGKTSDIEYSVSIDTDLTHARPKFQTHAADFSYHANNSTGVTKTGSYITLPYTSSNFINQKYATNTRNCTESMWKWNGNMRLYPAYDHYKEVKDTKPIKVKYDFTSLGEFFEGKTFGEWRTTGTKKKNKKAKDGSKTSTTTTELERLVTEIQAKTTTNSQNLGKYVTDVQDNPWMRSRIISFICSGMKPNSDMHVFFGGKNVDEHTAPGELSGLTEVESGKENEVIKKTGAWGAKIRSDAKGNVYGLFKIPEKKFRTGEVSFIVANVTDLEVEAAAILTSANKTYVASSTTITTGSTVLVTKTPELVKKETTQTKTIDTTVSTPPAPEFPTMGRDPIAQSFTIKAPESVSGTFITQIGVFFKTKDRSLGCAVVVMETSLGFPDTSKTLGRAYKKSVDITTSNNATSETVFDFDNPIYMENGKEYAFMVMPDGNSPEYTIWVAVTGNFDIATNEQVYANPYAGVLFISSTSNVWTPQQSEDIKFKVYRASFTVGSGTAMFYNDSDDYLTISGLTKANTDYRVEVGDAIIKVIGGNRVSNTANASYAYGIVQYVDEANDQIYLDSSNGKLSANDTIEFHRANVTSNSASFSNTSLIANAVILSVDNIQYHAVVPRFATMFPGRTSISYAYKGANTTYVADATWTSLEPETDNEFLDQTRIVASKSNEVAFNSDTRTASFQITLTTENQFVSPVIDLSRKSSLFVENIINNDTTNEHTRHGNAVTKYISQNVILDDNLGNAEDLNVYIGAYRPNGTDIEVYVKLQGSDDGELYDEKLWSRMVKTEKSERMYSSPIDRDDFREYEFHIANTVQATVGSSTTAYLNNGIAQYARSDGALIVGFKTFSFKVVLLSENSAKIPIVADLRAVALQK